MRLVYTRISSDNYCRSFRSPLFVVMSLAMVVAFFSLARILAECSTNQSPPAHFFFL